MNCEELKSMISARVDDELPPEQARRLEEHLAGCEACRRELAEMTALKKELDMIRFNEPTDAELTRYWSGVYNRLERGAGWILFSLGAIVLLCYGGFKLVEEVVRDPDIQWWVKGGVLALVFGTAILFVSLLRERLAVRKVDKYSREIER
ncbi:MAG TPA: zf-HC2 domain-containing protein [Phycisphaerae bacterium]|nr:zf-HC2 domain-containing protein [Phycisphaerae bacterium]